MKKLGCQNLSLFAASWAPMAAAVISGAIMAHFERESYILEPCRCIGGREWWQVRRDSRIVSDSLKNDVTDKVA